MIKILIYILYRYICCQVLFSVSTGFGDVSSGGDLDAFYVLTFDKPPKTLINKLILHICQDHCGTQVSDY